MDRPIMKLSKIIPFTVLLFFSPCIRAGKTEFVDQNCAAGLGPGHTFWRNNQTHELHLDIGLYPVDTVISSRLWGVTWGCGQQARMILRNG
ncbi:hypothetical protein O3M35_009206 [Rhynocoris fuscipes]|uniref:Uncharacterized protein n=1 Tax=Rhynocoris fuscipes TaxID=488301 RepID=A0AAW1D3B6_9HEMI